jgi:hypothetical protein
MTTSLRHSRRDEGNALVIAIMVMAVCTSLALVGIQTALSATRSSGVDRQRLLAINAAEAGVDSAYSAVQRGGLNPPCTISSGNVRSGPDVASYNTAITYYNFSGGAITCSSSAPLGDTPVRALITSAAVTNTLGGGTTKGARKMEALINLSPVNGNTLDKAIFANGTLSVNNNTTVTGSAGSNADIYSNTSIDCSNHENFAGSVYSQGAVSISNQCTFAGNVWAKTSVTTNSGSNGSIAGFVKASSGVINLSGVSVSGSLYAGSTISYGPCSTAGKCFPNSSPGDPPSVPFPILRGDATTMSAWQAGSAGSTPPMPAYTIVPDNNCDKVKDNIINIYAKMGSATLVRTTCAVNFSGDKTIKLSNDLAIFANGGFSANNQVGFASSVDNTVRSLYWVVPYDAATRPCTSPGITTDQQFSLTDDVMMLLYSPCNIAFSNNSTHIGQIYGGGDVAIDNKFTLEYQPLPVLGIDPSSQPALGYNPSIVYKRETR